MREQFVEMAREAGEVILEIYQRADVSARTKGDGSPVTQADAAAETVILKGLAVCWPDVPVIAEESVSAGVIPEVGQRFFLVDPLDGTAEFIRRSGEFTVNIALIEDGAPVAGVVYLPTTGEMFYGDARGACRAVLAGKGPLGWQAIQARPAPEDGLTVIASRRSVGAETLAYLEQLPVKETIRVSSSLKLCRLAEGAADLYPRFGPTSAWDIAAGDAVLRAAGGMVRTLDGKPLEYGANRWLVEGGFLNPHFVASGAFDPADLVKPGRAS